MSRIGNIPVEIPAKVQVSVDGRTLTAKGPKGELKVDIPEEIDFKIEDNNITFTRSSDLRRIKSLHGLSRSLTGNAIEGVTEGFKKILKIEGVGYKAELRGPRLFLSLGFSHPILIIPPDGIEFQVPNANTIEVNGIDKQLLGEVAATIRKIRPPEPYKGKGIRYEGEYVRRKAGKTAA